MQYQVIRSQRKTLSLEIREGRLLVRAPMRVSDAAVERFVQIHRVWIEKQLLIAKKRIEIADREAPLTASDIHALAERAKRVIPERVAHYADLIGVKYGRITVRKEVSGGVAVKRAISISIAF